MAGACTLGARWSIANPRMFRCEATFASFAIRGRVAGRLSYSNLSAAYSHTVVVQAPRHMTTDASVAWVPWAGPLLLLARPRVLAPIKSPRLRRRAAEQRRSAACLRRQKNLMDLRVAAASPTGDEVLAAVRGRINKLGRVDAENAARPCCIAGFRQRGGGVTNFDQIGVTRRRREVLAALAVGRFHDMDYACVWVRRCQ